MHKLLKTNKKHMFFVGWWPVALRWLPQVAQKPILLARSLRDPRKSNEAWHGCARHVFNATSKIREKVENLEGEIAEFACASSKHEKKHKK